MDGEEQVVSAKHTRCLRASYAGERVLATLGCRTAARAMHASCNGARFVLRFYPLDTAGEPWMLRQASKEGAHF